jgi:hypothetical protein
MLALNCSLLNREYTIIKCSEGLGFDHLYVESPCNFLIEDYTEIFNAIYKWDIFPMQCKTRHRQSTIVREVDPLCLILIDFDVPALTQGLH